MPQYLSTNAGAPAADEGRFRAWYARMSQQHGLNPNPDDPAQRYDYRAAFRAGAQPDASGHWPSDFKLDGHPNLVVGGFDVRTGQRVPGAPRAKREELIALGWDPATAARLAALPDVVSQSTEYLSTDPNAGAPVEDAGGYLSTDPHAGTPASMDLSRRPLAALPEPPQGSASSRFLGNAWQALNPVEALRGMAHAVRHPMQTYDALVDASADQYRKAGDAYRQGRYVEMVGHGLAGTLPVIGPAAAHAGEQIAAGDVAGGMGSAAGILTGTAAAAPLARTTGRALRPAATRAAETVYQSALKPTKAVLKDVRPASGLTGPDAARTTLVRTGLNERIPVSQRGVAKVDAMIDTLNAQVQAKLDDAVQRGATVDPATVEQAIADVAKDFTDQLNAQPDLAAIETVRQNFRTNARVAKPAAPATPANFAAGKITGSPATTAPGPIPVDVAQRMKVNTYKGLRGKYGVERGATIEAEKAGARGLREGIEKAAPEVADLNARMGHAIPLDEALADAMRRRGNYGIFGLTPVVATIPAVAHGNAWPLLLAMADRMPGLLSRTAIAMHRTGQRSGRVTAGAGRATVAGAATSPSESRSRTTAPGSLRPFPVR